MAQNHQNSKYDSSSLILFLCIIILEFFAALIGWTSDLYRNNSSDLVIKLKYYDLSLLAIVTPVSLISWILLIRNNQRAKAFSLGLTVYLAFSFAVTIFTCSQNSLFLIYIAILSLCLFYFARCFLQIYSTTNILVNKPIIIIGVGFWLSDALCFPLSQGKGITALSVKAPQVFDMASILPFNAYGAIGLMKNRKDGILISLISMIFSYSLDSVWF